jgi:hypothetical protein
VNWSYIIKLAISIFVAQGAIGFLGGFFTSSGPEHTWALGSHAVSLSVSGAIFAFFAFHQTCKPFLQASVALLVCQVAGLALLPIYAAWFGSSLSLLTVLVDLLVVVCALIVGTLIGIGLRRMLASQPDA